MSALASAFTVAGPAVSARRVASRSVKSRIVMKAVAEAEAPAKKVGPLERGGTLKGEKAAGKDAGSAAKAGVTGQSMFLGAGEEWSDPRWVNGTWDLEQFKKSNGETDWDAVIDAEVVHRKALEQNPAVYDEDGLFDTSIIPWHVWVRRFHLPEAEKVNGRAAMVGYAAAYLIDLAGGAGLVDLHDSFLGKTAIFATVAFCVLVRRLEDIDTFNILSDEATFYDKQWQATWDGVDRPSDNQ